MFVSDSDNAILEQFLDRLGQIPLQADRLVYETLRRYDESLFGVLTVEHRGVKYYAMAVTTAALGPLLIAKLGVPPEQVRIINADTANEEFSALLLVPQKTLDKALKISHAPDMFRCN